MPLGAGTNTVIAAPDAGRSQRTGGQVCGHLWTPGWQPGLLLAPGGTVLHFQEARVKGDFVLSCAVLISFVFHANPGRALAYRDSRLVGK